jgi:flagellar basal body rod protein FlgG
MLYGLYLSATGVMTNAYRQDVIANNLANSETIGFKRDLALFQERQTALQERQQAGDWSDAMMENLGGGILASATEVDRHQGELDHTGNAFDMALQGDGMFAVSNGTQTQFTRDGRMMLNTNGELVMANAPSQHVLDNIGRPIKVELGRSNSVAQDGQISQNGLPVARVGVYDVPDRSKLLQQGNSLLSYPDPQTMRVDPNTLVRSEYVENSNVDPTTELAELMDTQRQLESNANMIRYQDTMLQRLVNDVGKIS